MNLFGGPFPKDALGFILMFVENSAVEFIIFNYWKALDMYWMKDPKCEWIRSSRSVERNSFEPRVCHGPRLSSR